MKKNSYLLLLLMSILVTACSQMIEDGKGPLDFLPGAALLGNSEPPKIIGTWPLNEQTISDPRAPISLSFSREMNKIFTEAAVSLRSSQNAVTGNFSWIGSTLYFQPSITLSEPGIYTLTVSKSQAEDAGGKNLTEDFILKFSYNSDIIEPTLVASSPANGSIGVTTNEHIILRFSKPMNVNLVLTEVTTNPSVPFNLPATIISPDRTTFEFIPLQPLTFGTTYSVTIPNTIKDGIGNALLQTYRVGFTVGSDFAQPSLANIRSTTNTANFVTSEFTIIPGFEKTDEFLINFSEPILPSTLLSGVTFSPAVDYTVIENSAGANSGFILRPNSNLEIDRVYQIQVTNSIKDTQGNSLNKTYTYNVKVDGPRSRYLFVHGIFLNTTYSTALLESSINDIQHDGGATPPFNFAAGSKAFHVYFCRGITKATCDITSVPRDLNLVLSSIQFSVNFDFGPSSGSPYLLLPSNPNDAYVYKTSIFGLTESPNTYIFTVKGGPDGAKDVYGNFLKDDYSIRFKAIP